MSRKKKKDKRHSSLNIFLSIYETWRQKITTSSLSKQTVRGREKYMPANFEAINRKKLELSAQK